MGPEMPEWGRFDVVDSLRFDAAQDAARQWFTHMGRGGTSGVVTVRQACEQYVEFLRNERRKAAAANDAEGRFKRWVYLALSPLCFILYAADKSAARSGGWRTQESTLLVIGLVGGWPGAMLAQQFLRHKSVKASFRSAFWGTVILNVIAFVVLSSPQVGAWQALR